MRLTAGCVEWLCSLTLRGKVAAYGHACGVRVQKVLRVLRFDSGLWPLRVLKIDGPEGPKGS